MSQILLTFALTCFLFSLGCSSNTNPLALPGARCPEEYKPFTLALSEDEVTQGKLSAKPNFEALPNGRYELKSTDIYISELTGGEVVEGQGFRALLNDTIFDQETLNPILKEKYKTIINEDDDDESHQLKMSCLRNSKNKVTINIDIDALTQVNLVGGIQTGDYRVRRYNLNKGLGPKASYKMTIETSSSAAATPDDFYAGDNGQSRAFNKTIYQLSSDKPISEENPQLYEVRSESRTPTLLIRLRSYYKKL